MKRIVFLSFAVIILLLTGCKPNPTDIAKDILAQRITNQSNGALKLKAFTKINATSQQLFGVDMYEVEYVATVEAIKSGGWVFIGNEATHELWGFEVKDVKGYSNHQLRSGEVFNPFTNGKNAEIVLKKTENGWVEN
jgi:hypothetical protein